MNDDDKRLQAMAGDVFAALQKHNANPMEICASMVSIFRAMIAALPPKFGDQLRAKIIEHMAGA